jgi:RNA polymerase sigma-70 factor (ECF subfamily)
MEAQTGSLAASFIARLDGRLRDSADALTLQEALQATVAAAREAWPGLSVPAEVFVAYLGERILPESPTIDDGLRELRPDDLFLACACSLGDARALREFEARYAGEVDSVLVRLTGSTAGRDDVLQLLREKLFVAQPDRPPAIVKYGGRSGLRTWLGATLVRLVLNHVARVPKDVPVEDEILAALPTPGADPELELFKSRYAAEFRAALAESVAALPVRDRNLLRHGFTDGLSIDQIGALYGVHRATAARWMQGARQRLLGGLRRALMSRLGVDRVELDSIVRLIESRIDVSLRQYLDIAGD